MLNFKLVLVYEAKHHQKSSQTLMMLALPYSPLCPGASLCGEITPHRVAQSRPLFSYFRGSDSILSCWLMGLLIPVIAQK